MLLNEVIFEPDVFSVIGRGWEEMILFLKGIIFLNSHKCESTYFIQERANCSVLPECRPQRTILGRRWG